MPANWHDRVWDVLVVGAGPAGALAAYLLARRSLAVLLVERCPIPRAKVCGGCLNPSAHAVLRRAGLESVLAACHAAPVTRFQVALARTRASVALSDWSVVPRPQFDAALVTAAQDAGATCLTETEVKIGDVGSFGRICALYRGRETVTLSAGLVLAADGLGSRTLAVAQHTRDTVRPESRVGLGVVLDGERGYPHGELFMAAGRNGYVGVVRTAANRLTLGAAMDAAFIRASGRPGAAAASLLEAAGWPIPSGCIEQPWRGTLALTRTCRQPFAERLLAIGDAIGYVEPFTGEGMASAMETAEAVVPWVCAGWNPRTGAQWGAWCRRHSLRRHRLIRSVSWTLRRPVLAGLAIDAMHRFPDIAARVLRRVFTPASATPPRL